LDIHGQPEPTTDNMKKVGITGGIGSGKTTICQLFELLGIPIYYADDRAKALIVENEALKTKLVETFGEETYLPDGSYNRAYIANIVFSDKKELEKLNHIVHPAMYQDGLDWHNSQESVPYTLKEAIERVLKRDNSTVEAIKARIDKQLPDAEKIKLADYIILNDGKAPLVPQVLKIHDKLSGTMNFQ